MRVGSEFVNFDMLKAKPSKKTRCYVLALLFQSPRIPSLLILPDVSMPSVPGRLHAFVWGQLLLACFSSLLSLLCSMRALY